MSYRSGHTVRVPPAARSGPAVARQAVNHPPPSLTTNGYTLVHAGKQVRFGPVAFWIVVGTVTALGMWSAATATYFAFRDDVLTRLIARQAEMQYAYEDRIAELRAKVDRATSRQLLDQEQFDQKLEQIMRRQTALESRASSLGTIPDVTGSIRAPSRGAAAIEPAPSGMPKPSPISDTAVFVAPPDREARLESRAPILANAPATKSAKIQGVGQCDRASAKLARSGRAAAVRIPQLARRQSRIAHAAHARRDSPISVSTSANWRLQRRAPAWAAPTFR